LIGSDPKIWREIIVPENYSFFALNVAIQDVLGWEDSHLHQYFTVDPYNTRPPYPRIAIPNPEYDDGEDVVDERKAKIKEYLGKIGAKVYYEYDFGDSWMHEIEAVKILENDGKIKIPAIISGEMAAPPEDCGGIGGYYDLIEAVKNTKNPGHEDMMEWLGIEKPSDFDPAKFNIREIKFHDPKKVLARYEKFC
jgi:Plasmid pRiA4b ORF-3-like protein.